MPDEILVSFNDVHLKIFIDGTLGAGGHSELILKLHPEIQYLVGIDQDPTALSIAEARLVSWREKIIFRQSNFSQMDTIIQNLSLTKVDGILLDLGVSSMQFDMPEKGFSFQQDGPLDMRMDPNASLTAHEIINTWPERELGRIFRDYGEEKKWRLAARIVVEARQQRPLNTTRDLTNLLYSPLSKGSKKGIHPLTLIFQGLRICVNNELALLEETLPKAIDLLRPGGRLAVISFHSLEDRIVKNCFRYESSDKEHTSGLAGLFIDKQPRIRALNRKPYIPGEDEIAVNPRCRSAKLRVVEKL